MAQKERILATNVTSLSPYNIALNDYLLALKSEGKAPKTIGNYALVLRDFRDFAGPLDPAELNPGIVRRWLSGLADRGLTGTSRHSYLTKFKTWIRWLADQGDYGVDDAWLRRARPPALDTEQPDPLDEPTLIALFDRASPARFTGSRLRAMMALLVDTGVRLSELTGLTLADVDLENGRIQVRAATSKSRRTRTIALGSDARRELGRYWRDFRTGLGQSPASAFFATADGRPVDGRNVQRIIDRHAAKCGLTEVHPHRFRHTAAYLMATARYNPITIMTVLGHKDLRMTMRYIKLAEQAGIDEEKLAKSPLDQVNLRKRPRPRG